MNELQQLKTLKQDTLQFIRSLAGNHRRGYYRYSLTGDFYSETFHWNVGASVFALKTFYALGQDISDEIQAGADYIKTFRHGSDFYDRLIYAKTFTRNLLRSAKTLNFQNLANKKYIQAETRQCLSALCLYDLMPKDLEIITPQTDRQIEQYLEKLDWTQPWDAGSHFSHLLFFLNLKKQIQPDLTETIDGLIHTSVAWVNSLQDEKTGSWFRDQPAPDQQINGAMKVISGLVAADRIHFDKAPELIDLCLDNINDAHACGNFNIIYVLYYACKILDCRYRLPEIQAFARNRLETYFRHYHPQHKGFSFYPQKANDIYYGARITRGLNEPDIHGTSLLIWGIAIIIDLLGLSDQYPLRIYKT